MNDDNNITNCPKCGKQLRKTLHNVKYVMICDACRIAFDATENLAISLEKGFLKMDNNKEFILNRPFPLTEQDKSISLTAELVDLFLKGNVGKNLLEYNGGHMSITEFDIAEIHHDLLIEIKDYIEEKKNRLQMEQKKKSFLENIMLLENLLDKYRRFYHDFNNKDQKQINDVLTRLDATLHFEETVTFTESPSEETEETITFNEALKKLDLP